MSRKRKIDPFMVCFLFSKVWREGIFSREFMDGDSSCCLGQDPEGNMVLTHLFIQRLIHSFVHNS